MEKYIIHGHEVEYDTFDLDEMARYDAEVQRLKEDAEQIKSSGINVEDYISVLREQCENMIDFFDIILGDGMAHEIFGEKVNVKDILTAYQKFTKDVALTRSSLTSVMTQAPAPANREQRRIAEREQRRKKAGAPVTPLEK